MLVEFASLLNAVQCAVEIQELVKAKNTELSENRKVHFRFSINKGAVIEEGTRSHEK